MNVLCHTPLAVRNPLLRTVGGVRWVLSPPRKLYFSDCTPIQYWWHQKVPQQVKYFAGLAGVAWTIANVHYDYLVSFVPPVSVGGYFGYKWWHRKVYNENLAIVDKPEMPRVKLAQYDELLVTNVLRGIENEFDYYKVQLMELLTRQVTEYVAKNPDLTIGSMFLRQGQFNVNFGDMETFVFVNAPVPDQAYATREFIKYTVPFYSTKTLETRARVGVVEVYLLETNRSRLFVEYNVAVDVRPYKWGSSPHNWLPLPEGVEELEELQLREDEAEEAEEEFI